MKATICGFRQDVLLKHKISCKEAIFLRWIQTFISSGNTRTITEKETGQVFSWIKYSKAASDLPILFPNIFSVRRMVKKLCGTNMPLIKKINSTMKNGKETFFRINQIVIDELENIETKDEKMESLITGNEIQKLSKNKKKQKHPANKNVVKIFEKITSIKNNYDGEVIFNHKLPDDKYHYTELFSKFQNQMFALYEGRFLTNYKIESLKDWFNTQYKYYLSKTNEIQLKINSCKGSWANIEKVLLSSVKNYKSWFENDSEKSNKNKLPRKIDEFVYGDFTKTSMFYICLLEKCSTNITVATEKLYNRLPTKILLLVNPILKKENFEEEPFYRKINQLIKWYDKNINSLCSKDSNCQYWLQTRLGFIENYLEWISDKIGKHPKLGNFGIGNKTFDWYVGDKIKEHGIEIEIPRSLE